MTTKEQYKKAREESTARVFMEFDKTSKKFPKALFVFYEGKDNEYYYSRIEKYAGIPFEIFRCGGKAEVKKVYLLLSQKTEYSKYKTAFFIDKDFDKNDEVYLKDFFVTERYSIENYYTTSNTLKRILKNHFGFRDDDKDFAEALSDYETYLSAYNNAILLFYAWYGYLKRNQLLDKTLALDDGIPSKYISCDDTKKTVARLYDLHLLKADHPQQPDVAEENIRQMEAEIRKDLACNLRGKDQLNFMINFLNRFNNVLKEKEKTKAPHSRHYSTYEISRVTAIQFFSVYADTPKSLEEYIIRRAA